MLATSGPAKPDMQKMEHIIRAYFCSVFSEMTFIIGPLSIESAKPIRVKQIKWIGRLATAGTANVLILVISSPMDIIILGWIRSPKNPFTS